MAGSNKWKYVPSYKPERTLDEVANIMGITRGQVETIEQHALLKLRAMVGMPTPVRYIEVKQNG